MKGYAKAVRLGLAFFAVAVLSLAPTVASARSVGDSEKVSGFLAEAKAEALQLQTITEEMNSFMHSRTSWQTQAAKLAEMKRHFNKLGELVIKMNKAEAPSPWQQEAIRKVTPMVEELCSYITMTIYHLGEDPDRLVFTSFPEYVAANTGLASDIAELLSDYVEYGEAKQGVEELFELGFPRS
jgi:hypothetical protein